MNNKNKVVLIHSASMGEFEQAKPIIEKIKGNFPEVLIVATFYSPSGYENQLNYKFADIKLYLPFDTPKNIKNFLNIVKPNIAIFIRYDLWLNTLSYFKKFSTKTILVNATLPSQFFIREFLLRSYYKLAYEKFDQIFAVDSQIIHYLQKLNLNNNFYLVNDTRYDRVKSKIYSKKDIFKYLSHFFEGKFIIVAGSTWTEDEKILIKALYYLRNSSKYSKEIIVIYVPHEPTSKHIKELQNHLPNSVLFSELLDSIEDFEKLKTVLNVNVDVIVDSVGKLLDIYSLGNVAYVGGGFGTGIHSVIEPAGFGLPIACGPKIAKSVDAKIYKHNGFLTVVRKEEDFASWINKFLFNPEYLHKLNLEIKSFFESQCGATNEIVNAISKLIN